MLNMLSDQVTTNHRHNKISSYQSRTGNYFFKKYCSGDDMEKGTHKVDRQSQCHVYKLHLCCHG